MSINNIIETVMRKISITLIFVTIMSWFSFFSHAENKIDFNYPQDVSKTALADLQSALKTGDGELTVDALIRYSIAQSGISEDNLKDIIDRIEATIKKEKRPEIKALLYYFEARIFDEYMRNGNVREAKDVEGKLPSEDYSEWTAMQFKEKIDELLMLSVADRAALEAVKVTDLPNIIKCNELGATYVPTLYLFLAGEVIDKTHNNALEAYYIESAKAASVPAYLYAVNKFHYTAERNEVYNQYRDNEHCGMLLPDYASSKEDYAKLKDYLARFPKGVYAPNVQNTINRMEAMHVNLTVPRCITKDETANVKVIYNNVNHMTMNVYRVPDSEIGNSSYSYSLSRLEKVQTINLDFNGTVPFHGYTEAEVKGLDYGKYIIVPSYMADGKEQIDENVNWRDDLTVSDLAIFTLEQSDKQNKAFVVNPLTGAPVAGVEVSMDYKYDNIHIKATTDKSGMVVIPSNIERCEIKAVKGTDKYADGLSYYRDNFACGISNTVDIFTDLAIYRPGEKVKWAIVAYYTGDNSRELQPNAMFKVKFSDTNGKEITTAQVTTDEFGRAEGTFDIPTDRLNGSFKIEVSKATDARGNAIGYKRINVSEYKTPTFDITYTTQRSAFVAKEPVVIEGTAKTYSGLPVAGSEVKVTLNENEWSWNWRHYMPSYKGDVLKDTTVVTDAQGNFRLEFPAELFAENRGTSKYYWCRNNYSVEVKCTNAAGETHEATKSFIVGNRRGIEMAGDATFLNDKEYKIPITYNTTSETETSVVCTYELINNETKETVKTGNFDTADPKVDFTAVPSGEYTLKAHILAADKNEEDADAEMLLTLWRSTDKQAPVKDCALWVPKTSIKADANGKASFLVGTSTPEAHIYMVVSSHKGVEHSEWLHYTAPGMHTINVVVPDRDEEALNITLHTYYKREEISRSVYVSCEARERSIKMEATSFRDKLVPGTPERWTFKVTDKQGKPVNSAVMLEMFDKALNTLANNTWHFNPYWSRSNKFNISGQNLTYRSVLSQDWQRAGKQTATIEYPQLYMYNQSLFGYLSRANVMYKAAGGVRPMMVESMAMVEESAPVERKAAAAEANGDMLHEVEVVGFGVKAAEEQVSLDNVQMRMADVKTALWQPMLTTNAHGELVVEFDAPQFNTTWIVQGITWDKELYSSRFNREVLTQKEVMVKASLPRFVRTGDKATLTASVMNATDELRQAKAIIELFDPRTGTVVATKEFNEQLQPSGTNAVSIDWDVPESMAFVGFRIKAASGKHSDGEQVMVPVLASTQPIIETQPFYIEQNEHNHSVTVPSNARDARVTLEYCDNPTWYCVTALPSIFDENYKISTRAAHTLFTIDVAQGIAGANPKIKEAVDHWNANPQDSVLVSMLAKNQDLKIGNLLASPWLNESDRQTLRMSRIGDLMDKEKMAAERKKVVDALLENQNADGGWYWFKHPGAESSLYTTHEVLEMIGEIKHLGYLPACDDLDKAVKRALSWYDKEQVRIYNERKKYDKSYSGFSDFVYVRTLFKDVPMSTAAKSLFNNALKAMKKDWSKGLSLSSKAYFALTMERNGDHKTAAAITESIRQFSITKPELGTYWDNLQSGWRYFDKVAVTATILQALNEVDHRTAEIDGVRKWMLLMKQTNDWGSGSLAADAVYSLLSTGTDWLQPASQVSITVDGKALDIADAEKYLGYVRRTINAAPGAVINIGRDGTSPAWGAIYNQFKAVMSEAKQVSIDELSINKEYYVYGTDGKLVPATALKVGDKVQVRTVIKCNRDLDFVTVVDERASCFEPVDQLSGYRYADGTYYYLETKDSKTNAFYTSLLKGTHIISYDVYVTAPGKYSAGVASAQCQYAPQIAAHSAGTTLTIEK